MAIPTLNAAETLPETLAALRRSPIVGEVIIADGGSVDATVSVAEAAGARVIIAQQGRGTQLAAGAAAARDSRARGTTESLIRMD